MQACDGIVGEQRIGTTDEPQMMAKVLRRFGY
jgi:hypothetical protein